MDQLFAKIREIFSDGIKSLPGYQIGDGIAMALSTGRDIDSLPTTEEKEEDS